MRMTPPVANLCLPAVLCLLLASCGGRAPDATPAAQEPAAADPAVAAPVVDAAALEGDIIVSVNEPFWTARVSGGVLQLGGIEGQRELAVATSDTSGDIRIVRATDANGAVEVQVDATPCQDNMSGAMFPYTAVLVIDGGTPLSGCARPASMPPPGEGL